MIGIGRVGGALTLALARSGFRIDYLVHRNSQTAEQVIKRLPPGTRLANYDAVPQIDSDIILITTPDPDIADVAHHLKDHLEGRPVVLHTSGSLSSNVLSEFAMIGCSTGSLHPLLSISDPLVETNVFENAYFCIEGDDAAMAAARHIVKSLDGRPFSIPSDEKALYHAAAVTAAGHLVALMDVAIEMLSRSGVDDLNAAKQILLPLIQSTVANLERQTPEHALTGTFARADLGAFDRHLASIEKTMPPLIRNIYLLLGERSLEITERLGNDSKDREKLFERISIAKRKSE